MFYYYSEQYSEKSLIFLNLSLDGVWKNLFIRITIMTVFLVNDILIHKRLYFSN